MSQVMQRLMERTPVPMPERSLTPPAMPEPVAHECACGCGLDVFDEYEHYEDDQGNRFYDRDCVDKYYAIRYVG